MEKLNTILIVDDLRLNRTMLADMLEDEYNILEAANGVEALNIINTEQTKISLILLDVNMPKKDGFEVLENMNKSELINDIPVIMISAEHYLEHVERAYNLGASEFIYRPFEPRIIKRRVKNTILMYTKQKRLEGMVIEQFLEKERNSLMMVEILSHIVEFRNGESGLHVSNIRVITEEILKQLSKITDNYQLTPSKIAMISNASALHDIGKMVVPDQIINKPGKLTDEEFAIMKTHCAVGAEMLEKIAYYKDEELVIVARNICRWHHERYDGKGYPDGLVGEQIPIAAQVVALADVFDALTSVRVYKPKFSPEESIAMILGGECGAFNPLLLECLKTSGLAILEKLEMFNTEKLFEKELQISTEKLLNSNVGKRSLKLLEQEKIKYNFLISVSKGIKFEYNYAGDVLNIYGEEIKEFGLPDIVFNPENNEELLKFFDKDQYLELTEKIRAATPENPVLECKFCLSAGDEKVQYQLIAKVLWSGADDNEPVGVVGKIDLDL